MPNPDIARRVRAARGATGLSLSEFAEKAGVSRSTQIRSESGTRTPSPDELRRIAEAAEFPIGFFTAEDLHVVFDGESHPTVHDRINDLEQEMRTAVQFLTAADLQLRRELEAMRNDGRSNEGREGPDGE